MQYTGPPEVAPGHYQMQALGHSGAPSREETEEDRKERKKQQLVRRKVPTELWDYYLKGPEHWDLNDVNEDGLQKGVSAILIAPHTVAPSWVEKESVNKFVELKMKMTTVVQVVAEINRFADEAMPEDNQLAAERKQAQKRADKLQADLLTSCNELTALTVIPDECFGDDFYDNIKGEQKKMSHLIYFSFSDLAT